MKNKEKELQKKLRLINEKIKIVEKAIEQPYFDTAAGAAIYAKEAVEEKGFEVDENDWFTEIARGGRYGRLRPAKGNTHKFTIALHKDGKLQRKALQIQIHAMEEKYELNFYIN